MRGLFYSGLVLVVNDGEDGRWLGLVNELGAAISG